MCTSSISLPTGVAGLSLGTPGVHCPTATTFGFSSDSAQSRTLGRVFAHEAAHFHGLQNVENRGTSGSVYPPLDDTAPGQNNLMESGTLLTAAQDLPCPAVHCSRASSHGRSLVSYRNAHS